jgi:hypothetical protein
MSRKEMSVVVGWLLLTTVLALAGWAAVARAEPAQQFSLQVMQAQTGRISFRLSVRMFDTTGAVPPAPLAHFIRLPLGARLREEFLDGRFFCDGLALRDALDRRPSVTPFTQRIADLRPFIRELARGRSQADRAALANARACERARLGNGSGLIDARNVSPVLGDPIPVKFAEFLSRPEAPGAVAGLAILGAADERAPVVRRNPVVAGVHVALHDDLLDEPTPDGLYGYKVVLPTGRIGGFDVRIAEVRTMVRALELHKGTCLRRARGGRCLRRQQAELSSFVLPACPASGRLSAQMFASYAPPLPTVTTTAQLPCPRFTR